ncbi:LacI family DNA-binding transcriptional regulator [Brevibacillus fulvus]|uniref:LacI family repressor for deo operon, udp, cdd, tsx, nupC, and nupG n=1 Tax=Brevibacillus fulvus TaxID=1125967 RepID=A0A938Y0H4_9BACL|nr:LacI family DNA-binding transcriptional regulator [Brevibacillus fulvus]MBM7588880.1 LacI family repressor for deo operon, udp, cdd, tsx, nupC, and nupG [Brevibacillus fulvus]
MATIHDVAKLAKVSIATVSRVMSGADPVNPKTQQRVLAAMEKLNYRPNGLARNLRNLRTNVIIALMPNIQNPFFSEVIRGIEDGAREAGFHLLIGNTDGDRGKAKEYMALLDESLADGLILTTAQTDQAFLDEFAAHRPIVLACEYMEGSTIPTVSIDNISAARKVVKHLLALGHRRIAHIMGPNEVILSRARLAGYRQALQQHGLEVDEMLVQEGDFSLDSGYRVTRKLLSFKRPPTAIFAANDEMAIGAIRAIREHGLQIPDDISVAGFDDLTVSSFVSPSLTTIQQPRYEIGYRSVEMLIRLIRSEPLAQTQVVLDDSLVIRESSGVPKEHM